MNQYAISVINAIKQKEDPKKALWLDNYVKHDVKSYGVGIPDVRLILKDLVSDVKLNMLPHSEQCEFLDELIENEYTESKLATILYIQLYWKNTHAREILTIVSNWFDNKWITDWNVCDWLCVRILTPLLDAEPELAISEFHTWNKSKDIWKSRASLVPFALCKHKIEHKEVVLKLSETLILREERFCKTVVGWVLREYSKVDKEIVPLFLEKYSSFTTNEVIRNATKYIHSSN